LFVLMFSPVRITSTLLIYNQLLCSPTWFVKKTSPTHETTTTGRLR
jgi:hypothetical protein